MVVLAETTVDNKSKSIPNVSTGSKEAKTLTFLKERIQCINPHQVVDWLLWDVQGSRLICLQASAQ